MSGMGQKNVIFWPDVDREPKEFQTKARGLNPVILDIIV